MSQKYELKPCPFCGYAYDVYVHELNDPTTWWDSAVRGTHCFVVQCAVCGASVKGETNGEAIRNWNRRKVPEVSFSFEDFQEICYFGEDVNEDGFWKQTCRRKDMIPSGHSWGVCDKEHCPYVNK